MILTRPSSSKSRTVLRSSALPSPSEIRPLKSTIAMPLNSRVVANKEAMTFLRFLVRRPVRIRSVAVPVTRWTSQQRQALRHHNLRATGPPGKHIKLVHKCFHQKNAAAGGAQQVLLRQWVRHVAQAKAFALVQYVDHHALAGEVNGKMDLLFRFFLVGVMK